MNTLVLSKYLSIAVCSPYLRCVVAAIYMHGCAVLSCLHLLASTGRAYHPRRPFRATRRSQSTICPFPSQYRARVTQTSTDSDAICVYPPVVSSALAHHHSRRPICSICHRQLQRAMKALHSGRHSTRGCRSCPQTSHEVQDKHQLTKHGILSAPVVCKPCARGRVLIYPDRC